MEKLMSPALKIASSILKPLISRKLTEKLSKEVVKQPSTIAGTSAMTASLALSSTDFGVVLPPEVELLIRGIVFLVGSYFAFTEKKSP
jgi:hypothetical protein